MRRLDSSVPGIALHDSFPHASQAAPQEMLSTSIAAAAADDDDEDDEEEEDASASSSPS